MKGLTLIEIIIYISILVIIIAFTGGFLWNILLGNIKEGAWQEVQQNGRFVLSKMTQEVRRATAINTPAPGGGPLTFLSLAMADPDFNPTVFEVVDGKLRLDRGGEQFFLTSDRVVIDNLLFSNFSYPNTPGIVGVELSIKHRNPAHRNEYQAAIDLASITFHTWQTTAQTYNDLTLKYRYHADAGIDDTYAVAYSTDGGNNWIDLTLLTSQGSPDTTLSVTLSPLQDISQLQVKVYTQKVKGPDGQNIYTRDIWTEGSF